MIRSVINLLERSLDISALPAYLNWLPYEAPCFSLNGNQVSILRHPDEFYDALLQGCSCSKKRIALASLYLGTGLLEKKLIQAIDHQLKKECNLQVNILLDANRGSRGKINSRTMLLSLLKNYPQCQVSLFHTPSLRGLLRYLLPSRYNELVGLQHMKLYLFDDSVIISGANLSHDYFTNRQDRYILISECRELADFYWGFIKEVSKFSLALDDFNFLKPRSFSPYQYTKEAYVSVARNKIWDYYKSFIKSPSKSSPDDDTWIFPFIELPPLEIHHDSSLTMRILESIPSDSVVTLSTGYFNLTSAYKESIISRSTASFRILMAHPLANGFLKAGGLASGIPSAYTGFAYCFLANIEDGGAGNRVSLLEWQKNEWTFHAKGLWGPNLTLIGSSNFGERSVKRDLETQVALVTINPSLLMHLQEEENSLIANSQMFTPEIAQRHDRKPPFWVLVTMWIFKNFF